ncbi:MAG TPA: FkbM family methyltransferase [Chthoniobacterales bacterium]|jgi:FkbM family methyltransferase|nr:FkbM family methyltransferase [Chthoniobacterales bacterium]
MQSHANFVFHLDEPREQFRDRRVRLRGWITTQQELSNLRLSGPTERGLRLEERPDVRRAFPNYAFAIGFNDEIESSDLRDGALHFSFNAGGEPNTAIERLPPPPPPPPWSTRLRAQFCRSFALLRLRFARDPRSRWNAALSAFLLQVEISRGTDFRRDESDHLIALFGEIFPEAFVVQIGANDGIAGDPLVEGFRKTRWSGLLVEPVPYLYEMLVARYRDRPGMQVECAAISTRDGEAPLYRLRSIPGQTPEWFNQLASLDREVLLKHRESIPKIDSLLIEERVPTVRLDTLLARHGIARIDLLVVDTEGHDLEILRTLDLTRFRPTLLMFEHQHLSEDDKQAAYALLKTAGYDFRETPEGDAIAWRES